LTAGGIVKANTSGVLSIASVGDINSGMGYTVPVTGDGVYTIANGSRLNGIFHIHWEASNRAEDLVVQCSANQFDQGTITVLSYGSYTNSNSISNVSIYKASGGATIYLTVTLGNRNSGTASIGVTYFGMVSGMSFLGSYSGTAISSMTTVPYNSLGTSGGATIGGGLTVFGTGTAISAPNGAIVALQRRDACVDQTSTGTVNLSTSTADCYNVYNSGITFVLPSSPTTWQRVRFLSTSYSAFQINPNGNTVYWQSNGYSSTFTVSNYGITELVYTGHNTWAMIKS
jgi:hypothetical protein